MMNDLIDDVLGSIETYGLSNEFIVSEIREMLQSYLFEVDNKQTRDEIKYKAQIIINNSLEGKRILRERKLDDLGI